MKITNIDDQDHLNVENHPASPTCRLYHLEPIGVGTEQVERLSSYITRLAKAYCVTTDLLVSEVILPCLTKEKALSSAVHKQRVFSFRYRASGINGFSPLAAQCVQSLEILTSTMDLRYLTMLTWQKVICIQGLFRFMAAWCPYCYEEWRLANKPIYDPLLWILSDVNTCPRHEQWLVTTCPNCQKAIPTLNRVARPGYCPFCCQWLGNLTTREDASLRKGKRETLHEELGRTQQIGALLASAPLSSHPPSREQIALTLRSYADRNVSGNMHQLAKLTGYGKSCISMYWYHKEVPRLKTLLNFCSSLDTSLVAFLTNHPASKVTSSEELLNRLIPLSRSSSDILTEREKAHLRQQLQGLLMISGIALPSLTKIAARLGVGLKALRKHCPDQYQALRGSNKRWDSDEMKMYVRQTLQEALDGEEIFSLNAVQEYLGCKRRTLYRIAPDLYEAVNARYQKHFPRALIEGHLREALTHTGPLLSLNALAKQNGWDPGFARSLFPELCRRISSQYKAWQIETRQQQRDESYQKIREAIGTLHQKALYPTKSQICRLIGDSFFMMRADRRSVWLAELEILGYK